LVRTDLTKAREIKEIFFSRKRERSKKFREHKVSVFNGLDDGNIYRKTPYLMVKTMVSCKFSQQNQSIDVWVSNSIICFDLVQFDSEFGFDAGNLTKNSSSVQAAE
jgi:hypothetical protein